MVHLVLYRVDIVLSIRRGCKTNVVPRLGVESGISGSKSSTFFTTLGLQLKGNARWQSAIRMRISITLSLIRWVMRASIPSVVSIVITGAGATFESNSTSSSIRLFCGRVRAVASPIICHVLSCRASSSIAAIRCLSCICTQFRWGIDHWLERSALPTDIASTSSPHDSRSYRSKPSLSDLLSLLTT